MDACLNSDIPLSSLLNQYDNQIPEALAPETDFCSASRESLTNVFDSIGLGLGFSGCRAQLELPPWDEVLEPAARFQRASITTSLELEGAATDNTSKQVTYTFGEVLPDEANIKQQDDVKPELQTSLETKDAATDDPYKQVTFTFGELLPVEANIKQQVDVNEELQVYDHDAESFSSSKVDIKYDLSLDGNMSSATILKQSSQGLSNVEGEGLKKCDSFSTWMSKALAEVDDSNTKSTSQGYWNFMEPERVDDSGMSNPAQDAFIVGPSVSQDQLFSIIDFSPNWAYGGVGTKVLITGIFLKDKSDVEHVKLSCMFGEVEVPAEILADGILRCHAPPHRPGRVPFYITSSNRLACSEVREFEYRVNHAEGMEISNSSTCIANEMHFHIRLGKLLSLGPVDRSNTSSNEPHKVHIRNKINTLLMEADDKWFNMLKLSNYKELSPDSVKDQLLQKLLKEKLHDWLVQKITEDGKGPNVLDEEGQGVIHLTAALGYDWAIKPIITSGVSINFRDARGWTALHWAASCGRERTVVSLVTQGAATGALTDPTPDFPSGRTPADLASANGHKGIAGFLAESSLTSHLSVLTLKDDRGINLTDDSGMEGADNLEEQGSIQLLDGDVEAGLSLKDSLCAVRNAALAAARIYQVFRVDSFQRKTIVEYGDDQCGISDEQALSLVSVKTCKSRQGVMPVHAAAIRIQNRYRGWKGRKEFLITRQRIVKIQAHIRGHQVRKRYKKIVFTVGIWEKAILRWRRKGTGLRGFRSGLAEGTSMQIEPAKEDDYDFLNEGRKQTEARLDKALSRVKSMVQYREARDQYRRLLTVATELQGSNVIEEVILNESADVTEDDFMDELDKICDEESSLPPL